MGGLAGLFVCLLACLRFWLHSLPTPLDENINRGLVCVRMHCIIQTKKKQQKTNKQKKTPDIHDPDG